MWTEEKLPRNSKNWYKAKTVERCLIDRIRLIEYNRVRLYVRLMGVLELMHNKKEIDVQV